MALEYALEWPRFILCDIIMMMFCLVSQKFQTIYDSHTSPNLRVHERNKGLTVK